VGIFISMLVTAAVVLHHLARPYDVAILDPAIWVIALGFAAGIWGGGLSIYLTLFPPKG
tara:strand:+ start:256 stop:432 length:177 start_codon:yes stop_codon:yes gene_type:complete